MPDRIDIGDLRHRVTLTRAGGMPTYSPVGQVTDSVVAVGTYYAKVECVGGSKDANGNQLKGTLDYRVTMRANLGPFRPTDRLAWTNQGIAHTLNVVNSVVDPVNNWAVLDCVEKVPTQ